MSASSSFLLLIPELNTAVVAAENASTGAAPVFCRIAQCLAEVEGTYKSQYAMYKLTVGRKGGILQADLETDDGSFLLIPRDLDNLEFDVYSLNSGSGSKVVFYRDKKTQEVAFANYDRFLYRKACL